MARGAVRAQAAWAASRLSGGGVANVAGRRGAQEGAPVVLYEGLCSPWGLGSVGRASAVSLYCLNRRISGCQVFCQEEMLVVPFQGLVTAQQIHLLDDTCLLLVAPRGFTPEQRSCASWARIAELVRPHRSPQLLPS